MRGGLDIAGTLSRGARDVAMVRVRDAQMWSRAAASSLLLTLLLALAFQSYVVGTHYHLQPHATAAANFSVEQSPRREHHAPDAPDSCPICEEIAVAGAYLPAPSVDLPAPTPTPGWYPEVALWPAVPVQRSHAWRSRGPPTAETFLK